MPVQADWVFRQGRDVIRLTESPCINEQMLATYPPNFRPLFMQATIIANGKTHAPCWAPYDESTVIVVMPDGKGFRLEIKSLKVDPGV